MQKTDWPTGGVVRNDLDEMLVQEVMACDEARRGLLAGIQLADEDGDLKGKVRLQDLLAEADRRSRVRDDLRQADSEPLLSH